MQQKLAQIATIPIIIQSTLQSVSRTFEAFLPPSNANEPKYMTIIDEIDDSISIDSLENSSSDEESSDDGQHGVIGADDDDVDSTIYCHENPDSDDKSSLSESLEENESKISTENLNKIETPISTPEPVEPTEDELEKMRKQSKVRECFGFMLMYSEIN